MDEKSNSYKMLLGFFKNEKDKVEAWLVTPNPNLGHVTPVAYALHKGEAYLESFIESQLSGNAK